MVMLLGLSICLLIVNIYADPFTTPTTSTINDFYFINGHVYVATPNTTYLLDTSLQVIDEFSKSLTTSLLLYIDSDILLECGEQRTVGDDCCFLTSSSNFSSVQSNSSDFLCPQFKSTRRYHPCKDEMGKVFSLISFYQNPHGGRFSRMYFPYLDEGNLHHREVDIDIGNQYKSIAVSPEMGRFQKYLVIQKSASVKESLYIDPDLEKQTNEYASLKCDSSDADVVFGFGLKADSSVQMSHLTLAQHMTHFIMYESATTAGYSYRICSFSEVGEMKMENARLLEISKASLITLPLTGDLKIGSFNGMVVNGGIAGYFSVGSKLFKVWIMELNHLS